MIELFFFLFEALIFFLDIAIVPALTSYTLLVDLSLFFCFRLYEIKKEESLPYFLIIILIKSIFIPKSILLPFIVLYLLAFLFFIGIRNTTKMANFVTIGLPGIIFFTFEFYLLNQASFSLYIKSIVLQFFLWICLNPIITILSSLYQEKMKSKGVFV